MKELNKAIQEVKSLYQIGNFHQSLENAQFLLRSHPIMEDNAKFDLLFYFAISLKALNQDDDALIAFKKLDVQLPERYEGLQGKFQVYRKNKDWQKVIDIAIEMQQRFPNVYLGYIWEGTGRFHSNEIEAAKQAYKQVNDCFQHTPLGLEGLFKIAQHQEDWTAALTYSHQLVEKFKDTWWSYKYLAETQLQLKQYTDSAYTFNLLRNRFPTMSQGLEGQIKVADQQHDWQLVILLSEQLIAQHPSKWKGLLWQGQAYRHMEKYDKAIDNFNELRKQFPTVHQGLQGLIQTAQQRENWIEVIALARNFIKQYPDIWIGYQYLGNALLKTGQSHEASTVFNTFYQRFPNTIQSLQGLVTVCKQHNEHDRSLELLTKLIERQPSNWQAHWDKAQILIFKKEYDKALEPLNYLISHFANRYESYLAFIHIEKINNLNCLPTDYLDRALLCFPANTLSNLKMSRALQEHGFYNQAIDLLVRTHNDEKVVEILEALLKLYFETGQWQLCEECIQQLLTYNPRHIEGLFYQAHILVKMQKYSRAITLLNQMHHYLPHISKRIDKLLNRIIFFDYWHTKVRGTSHDSSIGPFNIKETRDASKIRVKLFAIAKDEAAYIPQWVYHHLRMGFDEIEVWINNSTDNSQEIADLIRKKDKRLTYRVMDDFYAQCSEIGVHFQRTAYDIIFRKELEENKFSHIMFLDLDELWIPNDLQTSIIDLVQRDPKASTISFPWFVDQPDQCLSSFDTALANPLKGRFNTHVKSIIKLENDIINITPHNATVSMGNSQLLPNLSQFTFDKCLRTNPYKVTSFYNNFKHTKELIAPEIIETYNQKGIQFFVYHLIHRSQMEYVSSLYRGNAYQKKNSLKDTRHGYIPFKDAITLSFESDKVEAYLIEYQEFIQEHYLDEALKIGRNFIAQRYHNILLLVEEDPMYLKMNMFKGVNLSI